MKCSKDDIAIIVALEEELPETILPEFKIFYSGVGKINACLLYTSPSPRDGLLSRMPSSA